VSISPSYGIDVMALALAAVLAAAIVFLLVQIFAAACGPYDDATTLERRLTG
jgi:hypothetical protein